MDVEKTMQFILEMQAKHEATIQQILETQAKQEEHRDRLESSLKVASDLIGRLAQAEIKLVERMNTLSQETDRRFRETDYKLNALIDTVDKLVKRDGPRP